MERPGTRHLTKGNSRQRPIKRKTECNTTLAGCPAVQHKEKINSSVTDLKNLIKLNREIVSARWELFGVPEDDGFLPAPTDYIILIAELATPDNSWMLEEGRIPPTGFIAPDAARPWLSPSFGKLMAIADDQSINSLQKFNCGAFTTRLIKSNELVDGFTCFEPGKVLLYLIL